jgi:hypothetical protein
MLILNGDHAGGENHTRLPLMERRPPPKGPKPRDIYAPNLLIDSIKMKTEDFRQLSSVQVPIERGFVPQEEHRANLALLKGSGRS